MSLYEATVEGAGTSGVGYQEMQNATVFQVGQNFPNPVSTATEIPLELKQAGEVFWALWSAEGQCVHFADLGALPAGQHAIAVDFEALGLPAASYLYRVEVETGGGRYTDVKRMTLAK